MIIPNLVLFCCAEDCICAAAEFFELSSASTLASLQSGLETVEELSLSRVRGLEQQREAGA